MLNTEKVLKMLKDSGALMEGHFKLTSGRHSDRYVQCALVLQYPDYAERLGQGIAWNFQGKNIDVVAAPALGGIVLGYEVARALGVRSIFTERVEGKMNLRRGFSLKKGEKVLVVEDVVTTGGSVKEVVELVRSEGAEPVGIGVIIDRSGGKVEFGVDFVSLANLEIASFLPEECSLCRSGLPLVKPGSRT